MRSARVWKQLIGVDGRTVIEDIEFEDRDQVVVAHVRPRRPKKLRFGRCEQLAPRYDQGEGRRRWRKLDLGTIKVVLETDAPRWPVMSMGWWSRSRRGTGVPQLTSIPFN